MARILAIAQKDLRAALGSWVSYAIFAAFFELSAFFFFVLVSDYQTRQLQFSQEQGGARLLQMNLSELVVGPMFAYIATFLIFIVPILTMHAIALEKREGTFLYMLSLPLNLWHLVLGKFVAVSLLVSGLIALTVVFPLALEWMGGSTGLAALDWQTVALSYLGLWLLALACIAVGLFASALTSSPGVAIISAFTALLVLLSMGMAARSQSGFSAELLTYLSLTDHFIPFSRGILRLQDAIYYLSLITLGLLGSHSALASERGR